MIIAEVGSVHDGSLGNALNLIKSASQCGADVVKFQTHIGKLESTTNAPNPPYFNEESRVEYFDRTSFKPKEWKKLKNECIKNNVKLLSSPFSIEAVDFLEELNLGFYKIPSGEITNLPLIEKTASLNKFVILSSGMSSWRELDKAVEILRSHKTKFNIMQCTSIYPCPYNKVGLNILHELKSRYKCDVGLSDHTAGISAGIAATILGATIIEKHFTFSKLMYGSDAKHSLEPSEFKQYASLINEAREMLDNPIDKNNLEDVADMKKIFQKSIYAKTDIKKGKHLSIGDLCFKKPDLGISAANYKDVLGKKTVINISSDELIENKHLK
ncbi:N-acetylneuraminate synthase [Candidatus Pacearchaeota archaeon]|nr:N-acetylneuraminate synthase [Candidatus Pacearchaeota archaeon]|tara:strand:- start:2418 stop:3401 length:984 start_codon:yes stop_codon:yes gene_type:complete